MAAPLLKALVQAALYFGLAEFFTRGDKAKIQIRHIATGVLLTIIAAGFAFIGVVLLVAALFFALTDLPEFVQASLITGIAFLLIAVVVFLESVRQFRRQRRRAATLKLHS